MAYPKYFNPNTSHNHELTIDYNNPNDRFHFEHNVNGRLTMSAVSYILMIWEVLAKLNNTSMDYTVFELRNFRIRKEVVLRKEEKSTFIFNRLNDTGDFTI